MCLYWRNLMKILAPSELFTRDEFSTIRDNMMAEDELITTVESGIHTCRYCQSIAVIRWVFIDVRDSIMFKFDVCTMCDRVLYYETITREKQRGWKKRYLNPTKITNKKPLKRRF